MFHKVKSVCTAHNYCIIVVFLDGSVKEYDIKPLFDEIEIFNDLKNDDLFEKVRVGHGGYAVTWNDDIDIACDELYENGVLITDVNRYEMTR